MEQNIVINKIIDYIEAHLEDELTLDKIASELNYSKFYIAKAFSEKTGVTVYKYIQGRRMTIGAKKLISTDKPIMEIAYEAQYNSQQAFTFAFKQLYNCTPQVYRKNGVFDPQQLRITRRNTRKYDSHIMNQNERRLAA